MFPESLLFAVATAARLLPVRLASADLMPRFVGDVVVAVLVGIAAVGFERVDVTGFFLRVVLVERVGSSTWMV